MLTRLVTNWYYSYIGGSHNGNYAKLLILRHCMKDKLNKVKGRNFWYRWLYHLDQKELIDRFWLYCKNHPKLSKNRCAYFVLKNHYSTIATTGNVQLFMWKIKFQELRK